MSVRIATAEDLPAILAIYAPYVENTTVSFEYAVPTLEEFTARFDAITNQFPWLVWEENGAVLGYAYGSLPFDRAAYRWCSEASVYIAENARGRGIGKALYQALELCLAKQGYRNVYALVTTENEASLAFHQAVGYRETARFPDCGFKMGRWLGVVWLEKLLNSVETPSNFPEAFPALIQNVQNLPAILANLSLS